jgi:hypothetical protein
VEFQGFAEVHIIHLSTSVIGIRGENIKMTHRFEAWNTKVKRENRNDVGRSWFVG